MTRIDLAEDRDRQRTYVNAVKNSRFHKVWKISRLYEKLLVFQGLCSMELVVEILLCSRHRNLTLNFATLCTNNTLALCIAPLLIL